MRCSRPHHIFVPLAPRFLTLPQVWASLCLLTELRHRVVLVRLLHLTGTVAACQRAARICHAAATAGRRLPAQQARLAEEAEARLAAMAV